MSDRAHAAAAAERIADAAYWGLIADPAHDLIVRAAEAIDIRELWDRLERLDPPALTAGDRANAENLAEPGLIAEARRQRTAVLEMRRLLCRSPLIDSRPLVTALRQADRKLYEYERAAADRARQLDADDEALREEDLERPRGPARRRRKHLVPIVELLRDRGWTYDDVAELVVGDEVWRKHPCPVTQGYWRGESARDLSAQLRLDVSKSRTLAE